MPNVGIIATIFIMEPTTGIEPVNLFLTKEALYRLSYVGSFGVFEVILQDRISRTRVERETSLELATFSLEG
jgi:hypothetical protein